MKNVIRLLRTQWDRAGAAALVITGLLALLLGWIGMSGSVLTDEQLPFLLSGGLVGLSLVTVGTGLWLSADMRDEWRRIDRLEEALENSRSEQEAPDILIPEAASADPPRHSAQPPPRRESARHTALS